MLQDQMPRGFVVLVVDDDAETVTLLAQLITDASAAGCWKRRPAKKRYESSIPPN
jgi:hypothetical protein